MKNVEVALEVPSGKLVCGNDFRDLYPVEKEYYVNEIVGIKQTIEEYGKIGLLHGYVGNSCPGIYKNKNTISILNSGYNKKTYDNKKVPKRLGKRVGGICTDLWWYCIADYDDFIKRGGKIDDYVDVVNVTPGRYVLSHDLAYNDSNNLHIYATIKKSDKPIKSWKLPDEGAAESIMKLLPPKYLTKKIIDVLPPKDADEDYIKNYWIAKGHNKHTIETRLFVRTAYKKPKIDDHKTPWKKIGYELWGSIFDGDKDHFLRNLIVSGKQLQDYEVMAKRAVDNFEKQKALMAQLDVLNKMDVKSMSKEEQTEYWKKSDAIFKSIYPDPNG